MSNEIAVVRTHRYQGPVVCADPEVPDMEYEVITRIDEAGYRLILVLQELARDNGIVVNKSYVAPLVFRSRTQGTDLTVDRPYLVLDGESFHFKATAPDLSTCPLSTIPVPVKALERSFREPVVQEIKAAGGWVIRREGTHLKATRPDGTTTSSWPDRPKSNGSGMYDLCEALLDEAATQKEQRSQWYALLATGTVAALGQHPDYESADVAASTLGDTIWLIDPETAIGWSDVLETGGSFGHAGVSATAQRAALSNLAQSAREGHSPDCGGDCQLCRDLISARNALDGEPEMPRAAPRQPRVVLLTDGGIINDVLGDVAVEVLVLDDDTSNCDVDDLREVNGQRMHMRRYVTNDVSLEAVRVADLYEQVE